MNNNRMLKTKGDPLGTVRDFLGNVWSNAELSGLLAPINGTMDGYIRPHVLRNPAQLVFVNPFKPLMSLNTAQLIPDLLNSEPESMLGVLLRPCEMRALIEMTKRDDFSLDNILTICIDCLGTYPANEFLWRAERKGSAQALTNETLQFAPLGGINTYRYRSACQLCVAPNAQGADMNISILGLPVRKYILISTKKGSLTQRLKLDQITEQVKDPNLISQHEKMLAKLIERRTRTKDRVIKAMANTIPADVTALIDQLDNCGDCQKCMEACPICTVQFPRRNALNQYEIKDITRWLVSCAGCGMCEQDCPQSKPLNAIFINIREKLANELDYLPGISVKDPLPV